MLLLFGFTNFLEIPTLKDRKVQESTTFMTNVFLGILFVSNLLKFLNFNYFLKVQEVEYELAGKKHLNKADLQNKKRELQGINYVIFSF